MLPYCFQYSRISHRKQYGDRFFTILNERCPRCSHGSGGRTTVRACRRGSRGVIGAETGGITQDIQEPDEIYASVRHDSQDACSLEFSFSSSENDSKLIEGISFADLTDSFCRQTQWIAKVWGSCTPYSDQKSIAEFFRRFCCCAHFLLLF